MYWVRSYWECHEFHVVTNQTKITWYATTWYDVYNKTDFQERYAKLREFHCLTFFVYHFVAEPLKTGRAYLIEKVLYGILVFHTFDVFHTIFNRSCYQGCIERICHFLVDVLN